MIRKEIFIIAAMAIILTLSAYFLKSTDTESAQKISEAMKAQVIKARNYNTVDEKSNPVFLRAVRRAMENSNKFWY
jgi:hypothetical protein